MFNAGFCTEHAEITRLLLAKELQADEAVCIKSESERDHLVTLFTAGDPEATIGKTQIIADSWNLGHAVLYDDSIYVTQELDSSILSPLSLPEDAKEYVAHVEMVLQDMISGRFFIDGKTMQEHLQEFRAQHREQAMVEPEYLIPQNVLAEEFR